MNPMLNFPDQPPNELIRPPIVYVKEKPAWEYRQLVRNLAKEKAPTEEELNSLGAEGWELAGVFTDSPLVYFYFKRWVE
jgi:hypothetical protein